MRVCALMSGREWRDRIKFQRHAARRQRGGGPCAAAELPDDRISTSHSVGLNVSFAALPFPRAPVDGFTGFIVFWEPDSSKKPANLRTCYALLTPVA